MNALFLLNEFVHLSPLIRYGTITLSTLIICSVLSVAQLTLRKQPVPVWTLKAVLLTAASIGLTLLSGLLTINARWTELLILFPFLQPLFLAVAWLFFWPIDHLMKRRIMQQAAEMRAQFPGAIVIGIAGSVGKTTTKELLKHLLQDLSPLATPAHVNTEMGVAQWLLKTLGTVQTGSSPLLLIEMGAYAKGEITLLCSFAKPTIGVMTRLGSDHLALFGSEQAIRAANAELLQSLPRDGTAFVLEDDSRMEDLQQQSSCPLTVIGFSEGSKIRGMDLKEHDGKLLFSVASTSFHVPMQGAHNAGNALLALAVAQHLGIDPKRVSALLATFRPLAHTFTVRNERDVTLLDDTYNISPLSFAAALDWAKNRPERPRVLLTGGLLETGQDEEKFLEDLGASASQSIERAIFLSSRGTAAFSRGFGKPVEELIDGIEHVKTGSLLLCVGRMSLATIHKLLPDAY